MYDITLESFPAGEDETFRRVLHKHDRDLEETKIHALLAEVKLGRPQKIKTTPLKHVAENLVLEVQVKGGKARFDAAS